MPSVETSLGDQSSVARRTISLETDYSLKDIHALADIIYDDRDIGATISSGSFRVNGMGYFTLFD